MEMDKNRLTRYIDDLIEMLFDAEEVGDDYRGTAYAITSDAFKAFTASRITGEINCGIIQATWLATTHSELRDELHKIGGGNEETPV